MHGVQGLWRGGAGGVNIEGKSKENCNMAENESSARCGSDQESKHTLPVMIRG